MQINSDRFFSAFLALDAAYHGIAPVLEALRREMEMLLGRDALSLSGFIDLTSIEYDADGGIVPKDKHVLRNIAEAMRRVDVTREALRHTAASGLTPEQIAEGPTSIKLPTELLRNKRGFHNFAATLHSAYHGCDDFSCLVRKVLELKLHNKVILTLFDVEGQVTAYFYPARDMIEIQRGLAAAFDEELVAIYNAKSPLEAFCASISREPEGHVKIIYLGARKEVAMPRAPVSMALRFGTAETALFAFRAVFCQDGSKSASAEGRRGPGYQVRHGAGPGRRMRASGKCCWARKPL